MSEAGDPGTETPNPPAERAVAGAATHTAKYINMHCATFARHLGHQIIVIIRTLVAPETKQVAAGTAAGFVSRDRLGRDICQSSASEVLVCRRRSEEQCNIL